MIRDLNAQEYKKTVDQIEILLSEGPSLAIRISAVAQKYRSFEIAEDVYKKVYAEDFFGSTT